MLPRGLAPQKALVGSDRFPDFFILDNKIITTLTGLERGRMHVQADLAIRRAFPNFFEGLFAHITQRLDLFARHAADVNQAVEINETVSPRCIAGTGVVIAEGVPTGASQLDLGLVFAKGERIIICERYAQLIRTLLDDRRDLRIE